MLHIFSYIEIRDAFEMMVSPTFGKEKTSIFLILVIKPITLVSASGFSKKLCPRIEDQVWAKFSIKPASTNSLL